MADPSDGEEIVEDTTGLIVETREGRFEVGPLLRRGATGALPAVRTTGTRGCRIRHARFFRNPRNFFTPMTHLPLRELKRALVPANLKQLHEALLVGSAANDVANQLADVLHASAEFLLYERDGKMTRGQ